MGGEIDIRSIRIEIPDPVRKNAEENSKSIFCFQFHKNAFVARVTPSLKMKISK